jgi:UDP-N-acetylmuramate: L-alanyl-gamma-D-glutamyl-meso-diaminopimelate ligase
MHLHILGICGTFMAGVAVLAKQQGHHVTGSDANVYPPMSTQLEQQGIVLYEGYSADHLKPTPDLIIVGNAMKRGNPAVEYMLDQNLAYISGPQWLAENVLRERWVLAVAGTHGKTTTTSMLAWILEYAGLKPGFLIGGIPQNFGVSARLGEAPFFVIEADEYDSAFFDKRSKFVHYKPRTIILNNVEFDHADIFPDLAAIQTQFHHLVRTIPSNGLIVCPKQDQNLKVVLDKGCWTPVEYSDDEKNNLIKKLTWDLLGEHNLLNAQAAILAARHAGVPIERSIEALNKFQNVKRRMEIIWQKNNITIYDDFAHHPTAITTTLKGLRDRINKTARIVAIVELGSYTMRTGVHRETLIPALNNADRVMIARPKEDWGVDYVADKLVVPANVYNNVEEIISALLTEMRADDHIVIMSNTGFDGIHQKLLNHLAK